MAWRQRNMASRRSIGESMAAMASAYQRGGVYISGMKKIVVA
jgi:hypothetical protein